MTRLRTWLAVGLFLAFGTLWEAGERAQDDAWEEA